MTGRASAEEALRWLVRHLPVDNSALYTVGRPAHRADLFMMAATDKEKVKKAISFYFTSLRRMSISSKVRI